MYNLIIKLLAKAIGILSSKDINVKNDLLEIGDNYFIKLTDFSGKIFGAFCIRNQTVFYVRPKDCTNIKFDMSIVAKRRSVLKKMLMGKISCKQAFNNHELVLYGNIFDAMKLVRIIDIVEQYIFPKFWTKKIFDKPYKTNYNKFKFYCVLLFGKLKKIKIDEV